MTNPNKTTTPPPQFTAAPVRYESAEDKRLKAHTEIVRGLLMIKDAGHTAMSGLGMVIAAYARLNGVKI